MSRRIVWDCLRGGRGVWKSSTRRSLFSFSKISEPPNRFSVFSHLSCDSVGPYCRLFVTTPDGRFDCDCEHLCLYSIISYCRHRRGRECASACAGSRGEIVWPRRCDQCYTHGTRLPPPTLNAADAAVGNAPRTRAAWPRRRATRNAVTCSVGGRAVRASGLFLWSFRVSSTSSSSPSFRYIRFPFRSAINLTLPFLVRPF